MKKISYKLTTPDGKHTITRTSEREYDYAAFRIIELEDGTVTVDFPGSWLTASFGSDLNALRHRVQERRMVHHANKRTFKFTPIKRVLSYHVIPTHLGAAKGLTAWSCAGGEGHVIPTVLRALPNAKPVPFPRVDLLLTEGHPDTLTVRLRPEHTHVVYAEEVRGQGIGLYDNTMAVCTADALQRTIKRVTKNASDWAAGRPVKTYVRALGELHATEVR